MHTGRTGRRKRVRDAALAADPISFSELALVLSEHIGWGFISPNLAQKVAHAAVSDGLRQGELQRFAKAGNFGRRPGNVYRDIFRFLAPGVKAPQPENVYIPIRNENQEIEWIWHPMIPPHALIAWLREAYPDQWPRLSGCDLLATSWALQDKTLSIIIMNRSNHV